MRSPIKKLVLTIDGKRFVFAVPVAAGQDPMEMTLGQWMAAPAFSATALFNDFMERRATHPHEGG